MAQAVVIYLEDGICVDHGKIGCEDLSEHAMSQAMHGMMMQFEDDRGGK